MDAARPITRDPYGGTVVLKQAEAAVIQQNARRGTRQPLQRWHQTKEFRLATGRASPTTEVNVVRIRKPADRANAF